MKKILLLTGALLIAAGIVFGVWIALQPRTPEDYHALLRKQRGKMAPGDRAGLEKLVEQYRKTQTLLEEKFPGSEWIETVAFERISLVDQQIGDVTAALDLYRDFVETFEESILAAEAWYRIGEILLERKEYLASVEAFRNVVLRFPDHALATDAQYRIGMIFVQIREYGEALNELEKVVEHDPDSPLAAKARLKMADLLSEQMEQRQEALTQLQQIQERHPGSDEARVAAGMERALGEEEAIEQSEAEEKQRYGAMLFNHHAEWRKRSEDALEEEIIRQGHALLHHEIEATIHPEQQTMHLRTVVHLRSGPAPQSHLLFRLGEPVSLKAASRLNASGMPKAVTPESEQAIPLEFEHDGTALICRFPENLTPGEELFLYFVSRIDGHHPELQGAGSLGPKSGYLQAWSGWYPMTTHRNASTSRSTFRIEAPFTLVGSGALENETVLENGWRQFVWTASTPYVGQSMAYGDYSVESRRVTMTGQSFSIRAYFLKGNQLGAVAALDETEWILQFYSETFCPFPDEEIKLAEVPGFPGGFGACTLVLLHSEAFHSPLPRWLLAHELSQAWWGHLLQPSADEGGIPWLHEGFAAYSEILYQEQIDQPDELQAHLSGLALQYVTQSTYLAEEPIRTIDWTSPMYRAVTSHKGALTLHTLRSVMGEEAFFRALREYIQMYRFGFVTVEDFRRVCESFYSLAADKTNDSENEEPDSLAWFFEQWMDRSGLPILRLADVRVDPSGMKTRVEFAILQDEYVYRLPLEIRITGARQEKWDRVWLGLPDEFFEYELEWTPRKIELDPKFRIFKDPRPSNITWTIRE